MSTKNDITGDSIRSKPNSEKYRDNFDKIFKKNDDVIPKEKEKEKNDD